MDPATPHGEAVWSSPTWLREAGAWIDERLADAGRERAGAAEAVRVRRWSALVRAATAEGPVWMKADRPECAIEVALYARIEPVAPAVVPTLLATDHARGWLLLADAGTPLVETEGGAGVFEELEALLPRYADLQRALAPEAADLLTAGGADHRPASLETVLEDVCDETADRLRAAGDPHGALTVIDAVRDVRPEVARWARRLGESPIGTSVDHGDLTLRNVLTGPTGLRIVDWGDAVVCHPFASLRLVLASVQAHLGIAADDSRLQRLRDAYLERWSDLAEPVALRAWAATASRLSAITRAAIVLRATRSQPGEAPPSPSWATFCARELEELLD